MSIHKIALKLCVLLIFIKRDFFTFIKSDDHCSDELFQLSVIVFFRIEHQLYLVF